MTNISLVSISLACATRSWRACSKECMSLCRVAGLVMLAWHALTSGSCFIFPAIWAKTYNTGQRCHHECFKNRSCNSRPDSLPVMLRKNRAHLSHCLIIGCDHTSLQSVKNLCSWCDAASICLRVSISSSRSAHDSFSPSFHSAIVAASEWPQSIISFTILFTCSMRCWPMLLVSDANLVNLSWRTWNTNRQRNATETHTNMNRSLFS